MHSHEAGFLFCYDHRRGMTGFTISKTLFLQVTKIYGMKEMFIDSSLGYSYCTYFDTV